MPQQTGRIAVNGKILTFKQSRLFEKLMQESPTFQERFKMLSQEQNPK